MAREQPERKSPIRARFTLTGEGTGKVSRSVFCTWRQKSVPLASCIACPKLVAFPARPTAIGAFVKCGAPDEAPAVTSDVGKAASRTHIGSIMNRNVACVAPSAEWESLERLLLDEGFDAVPVIDASNEPIGIVSKTDLLRRARSGEGSVEPGLTAGDVMTPLVHALPEDAPLAFALALLALQDVEQIPIVSNAGVVVGMVTARDAVGWLARSIGCIADPPPTKLGPTGASGSPS